MIQKYFSYFLWSGAFFILSIFFLGGFNLQTSLGVIHCQNLTNPILGYFLFLGIKGVFDLRWRNAFLSFLKPINCFAWIGVSLGSLGLGLWMWDLDQSGKIWAAIYGEKLSYFEWKSLKNDLLFYFWIIQLIWIRLALWRSRTGKENLSVSLGKVIQGLSPLFFSFSFLALDFFGKGWDYRYLGLSLFLGGVAFSVGWTWPASSVNDKKVRKILWISIVSFCVIFIVLSQCRYHIFRVYEDFWQSAQALWSTLHGQFMHINGWVFTGEGKSFFAQHFQPLLILFVPLYALWSDPRLLLLVLVLGAGLAAWPLYLIAKERTQSSWLALAFAWSYLYSPFVQRATMNDFHLENFVPLFFFSAFYLLKKRHYFLHGIACLMLLSIREDCFSYVMVLGLYGLCVKGFRRIGLMDVVLSVAWIFVVLGYIVPHLKGATSHVLTGRYAYLHADTVGDLIRNIISQPKIVFKQLTDYDARLGFLSLSLPLLCLPWLSWRGLLMITPITLIFFLSDFKPLRILAAHYSVLILPNYLLGAILTAENFLKQMGSFRTKFSSSLTAFLFVSTFVFNFFFLPSFSAKHGIFDEGVVEHSPLGKGFSWHYYADNAHQKLGRQMIKKYIPEGVPLATQMNYMTYLSNRLILRHFPYYKDAEYILLDLSTTPIKTVFKLKPAVIAEFVMMHDYGVVAYQDGWLIMKKGFSKKKNSEILYELFGKMGSLYFLSRTGDLVPDTGANTHVGLFAQEGKAHAGFMIFGRYWNLPRGQYRAIMKFKTSDHQLSEKIGIISVTGVSLNQSWQVIYQKEVRGTDFYFDDCYQDFVFDVDAEKFQEIEFRVFYKGRGDITFGGLDLRAPQISVEKIYFYLTGKNLKTSVKDKISQVEKPLTIKNPLA